MSDWVDYSLGEIATIEIGGTPSRGVSAFWAVEGASGFPWVSIADLNTRVIYETKERITARGVATSNVKRVQPGSLMMSFKLSIGRAALAGVPLFTNEAIASIVPRDSRVDSGLLYYVLPPEALNAITDTAVKGATLNKASLARLRIRAPKEPGTQQKIARILQTVDRAMEKTEALIEKYQQIKAGLMHDLFTRGLWTQEELDRGDHKGTPSEASAKEGQLRPTRQDAPHLYQETPIGWIPKAWDTRLLGSVVNPQRPIVYGILMPGTGFPGGVPVVKVKDINHRRIAIDNLLLTSPAIDREYRRSRLKVGDVLLTIRGTVGRICIVPNELQGANITQDTARIDIVDGNSRFFSYYFETEAAVKHFDVNTLGQAVKGINLGEVRKTPVVLPPREEQDEIARRIDSAHQKLERETLTLAKLQKQKAGLMHDLLTGKVPVTPDPEEAGDV